MMRTRAYRVLVVGIVVGLFVGVGSGPAAAQDSEGEQDASTLLACLNLVGDDVSTLFPKYQPVVDAVDLPAADAAGMPEVAACFEELSLDELDRLYQAGPEVPAYVALVDEYGSDWDEWIRLWIDHNPETQTALLLGSSSDDSSSIPAVVGIVVGIIGLAGGAAIAMTSRRKSQQATAALAEAQAQGGSSGDYQFKK